MGTLSAQATHQLNSSVRALCATQFGGDKYLEIAVKPIFQKLSINCSISFTVISTVSELLKELIRLADKVFLNE